MYNKLKSKLSIRRFMSIAGLALLVVFVRSAGVQAQTVTQGYGSDAPIQRATIVALKVDEPSKVEPVNLDNQDKLQGVVVGQNDAPFTISAEDEKVFVATTGRFETLVSDENGPILPGDFIAVSRVAGIGMKASELEPYIVGKAINGFDGQEAVLSTTSVRFGDEDRQVTIGRVQVDVGVGGNPLLKPTKANLPGFLERLAENIADKPVSPTRIYMGMGIFFAAAIISGTLLYSGVRSGIISVGRNPLSKKSITRSLMQIILTSVIILLLGIFAVYLLLRL